MPNENAAAVDVHDGALHAVAFIETAERTLREVARVSALHHGFLEAHVLVPVLIPGSAAR